jgi:hypothetical protein
VLLLSVIFIFGCKRNYTIEGNKVYFNYWNEGSGNNKWLISQADGKTFQSLDFDCNCSFTFGKDKSHVFVDGIAIRGIDPNSFKFIGNYIFRDKDSAYFFGFYNDINECRIQNVNPDEIVLIRYPWAKAGDKLIHGSKAFQLDNLSDFSPIDEYWGKTKNEIIYHGSIMEGVDYNTFQVVDMYNGKDKYHEFRVGKIVK